MGCAGGAAFGLDDHSRYVRRWNGPSPEAKGVQEALKRLSASWGAGRDADRSWDAVVEQARLAGWTRLTVWLMNQGIELHFSGYRHPQTQGKVERFHGSMVAALLPSWNPTTGNIGRLGQISFVMNTILSVPTKG